MSRTKVNFDCIARIYDPLARLVFGDAIKKSQLYYLNEIKNHSHVLIVGGGTGWIIPEIFKAAPSCHLTYIEASEKMLEMSRKKVRGYENQLTFIKGTEKDIPLKCYDVVITNFLLDLYEEKSLKKMVMRISKGLKGEGLWIFTDFTLPSQKSYLWQKGLLKFMYLFFKLISGIEAKQLPAYDRIFAQAAYGQEKSKSFYYGMIESRIYKTVFKLEA